MTTARVRDVLRRAGAWTLLFALNLPLAAALGMAVTRREAALAGAAAGAWGLWAGWLVAGARWPRVRPPLAQGAVVTAVAQAGIAPHLAAGAVACKASDLAFGSPDLDTPAPAAFGWGLSAAVLTGHAVMLPVVGLVIAHSAAGGSGRHRRPPARPDPDDGGE